MKRFFQNRSFRVLRLRGSSLPLAGVLLLAMALVLASLWFEQASAGWLVVLAACLAMSVLLLLWRQLPVMWRDLSHYRQLRPLKRMQAMRNHVSWRFNSPLEKLCEQGQTILARRGYRMRLEREKDQVFISAMKGKLNRLGFILSHLAVLLILLGALLDSDLALQYQLRTGRLQPESRELPLNEMAAASRIPARSRLAFQGMEEVQAGQIIDEVRVATAQGFLTRHLPYAVSVLSVELDSRQILLENNFLSRVAILDPKRDTPLTAALASNRPLRYHGYVFYQQAVHNAGSELAMAMWPLQHASLVPLRFRTRVGEERRLQTRQGGITIRFIDLKPRNVQLIQQDAAVPAVPQNIGPSLFYEVTDLASGEREFVNYLLPVKQNGRYFQVTGIRDAGSKRYEFVHIPVDNQASLNRFLGLHAALYDQAKVDQAISKVLMAAGKTANAAELKAQQTTMQDLLGLFREGGFAAIDKNIASRVTSQNYPQSRQLSHKLIRSLLYAIYTESSQSRQHRTTDEAELLFFEDAMPALSHMAQVAMPFYLQLQDIQFKPAVSILVSHRPGEMLFFGGWLFLLAGLSATFASAHRRLWLIFESRDKETQVSMAGMGNRQGQDFVQEFNELFTDLQKAMQTS